MGVLVETSFIYPTPKGKVTIATDGEAITRLIFGAVEWGEKQGPTALMNEAANQLQEYLAGRRKAFDLPLRPRGSEFQLRVWRALVQIPYGEVRSYAQIALAIGNEKALRAVGGANNKNPLPIFIPCHRVVGADGSLVGYAAGLKIKKFLLDLEQAHR